MLGALLVEVSGFLGQFVGLWDGVPPYVSLSECDQYSISHIRRWVHLDEEA